MGIPTFFRNILKNNRRVIQGAKAGILEVEDFFMDFNSIIYNEWASIPSEDKTTLSEKVLEKRLIQNVVERTIFLVNDIVQPKRLAYLSFDGPAPKAKIVQQRSRRYKSVQSGEYLTSVRERLHLPVPVKSWDPSSNICPGTSFMHSLSHQLQKAMAKGRFCCSVTLSDSSNPGEGEHKILPYIRSMQTDPEQKDKTVVIYSPDGDMISLGLLTHKSKVHILRFIDSQSEHELHLKEKGFELLYCSLDMIRHDFRRDLSKTYPQNVDEQRILMDYNFLLAMVGNDFVPSLPFLKIRSGGLDLLIDLYNQLRPRFTDYLILEKQMINVGFLTDLFLELSKLENREMRKEYSMLMKEYEGQTSVRREQKEGFLSEYEIIESRYYHMSLFHPQHPLGSLFRPLWNRIQYHQEKHQWKGQYYTYFCGWNVSNTNEYNKGRTEMVQNYLESLIFTLRYYTTGVPSWNWHYRYRVAPIPSDVWTILSKHRFDPNRIVFERGQPYTPFQQLMMILPKQSLSIIPSSLRELTEKEPWKMFYPTEFQVDALAGIKYIYSEAILPEQHQESTFLDEIKALESALSGIEKKRNLVSTRVKKYIAPTRG